VQKFAKNKKCKKHNDLLRIWLLLILAVPLFADFPKVAYVFSPEPIDVIIPCAPKDAVTLEACIEGIRRNGANVRRVIVISREPLTEQAEWFNELEYPFSMSDLTREIVSDRLQTRMGWIFQQFLKLYAPFAIPGISSNVLVLDADVIFLNPVRFMNEKGEPFFNVGNEYYEPYFKHAARLLPELRRVYPGYSGICHYMLFQRPILDDLFGMISSQHGCEPWKAFCRCIDPEEPLSPLSEYEIYFNFALLRTNQAQIRPLKWVNTGGWSKMEAYRKQKYVYMACQEWIRALGDRIVQVHPGGR